MQDNLFHIDAIDRKIIQLLQINGRSPASRIAKEIKMSVPAVSERIKKLIDFGVITGFEAKLDFQKIGLDVQAIITIISESSEFYASVVKNTNNCKEIIQCYSTTGNGSHLLFAIVENSYALEKLLRKIQSWPGVMRTETQLVLSSYKG